MGAPAVMDGDDGVGVVGDWFQSSGLDDETVSASHAFSTTYDEYESMQ